MYLVRLQNFLHIQVLWWLPTVLIGSVGVDLQQKKKVVAHSQKPRSQTVPAGPERTDRLEDHPGLLWLYHPQTWHWQSDSFAMARMGHWTSRCKNNRYYNYTSIHLIATSLTSGEILYPHLSLNSCCLLCCLVCCCAKLGEAQFRHSFLQVS